ncbi:hypothetical protein BD770DRAFT_412086 [Pilaira anomala]|nr:hypothetical protein BD770DRAFT_412086 [Pilaira anomala]
MSRWNNLPADILLMVFQYVASKRDITIMRGRDITITSFDYLQLTCKQWNQVARYVYQKIKRQVLITGHDLSIDTPETYLRNIIYSLYGKHSNYYTTFFKLVDNVNNVRYTMSFLYDPPWCFHDVSKNLFESKRNLFPNDEPYIYIRCKSFDNIYIILDGSRTLHIKPKQKKNNPYQT